MHMFTYQADVPYAVVVVLSFCIPPCFVLVCEMIRWKMADDDTVRVVTMCIVCDVHSIGRRLVRFIATFLAGILMTMIFVDVTKIMTGRLRPVFLDVCAINTTLCNSSLPTSCSSGNATLCYNSSTISDACYRGSNNTCSNASSSSTYLPCFGSNITVCSVDFCTQSDSGLMRWARLSFPSFHAAITSFSAVFMAIYSESMITRGLRGHVLGPFIATCCVMTSLLCGLSRYALFHSHWTDIAVGFIVGTLIAIYICVFVLNNFDEYEEIERQKIYGRLSNVRMDDDSPNQTNRSKSKLPWYWTAWNWNMMENLQRDELRAEFAPSHEEEEVRSDSRLSRDHTSRDHLSGDGLYTYY